MQKENEINYKRALKSYMETIAKIDIATYADPY